MSSLGTRVMEAVRRNFTAGVLVFVPIISTIIAIFWVIERLDNLVLPKLFRFIGMEGEQPPFLGVIVTLLAILLVGFLARSIVGRTVLAMWESMIERVPVAGSLYSVLKQFMQAMFGEGGYGSFSRVVLLEYPRRDVWCYGFVTGYLQRPIAGVSSNLVSVFVPSTPNPTTGYYLLIPEEDLRETGLSVDDAFRIIVSAGIASAATAVPEPTFGGIAGESIEKAEAQRRSGE